MGQRHLAACGQLFQRHNIHPGASGIERCRIARRAAADDDHIMFGDRFFRLFFGHHLTQEVLNHSLGGRLHDIAQRLSVLIQDQRRNPSAALFLEQFLFIVDIHLAHRHTAPVFLRDLIIGLGDAHAVRAPRRPKIHQYQFVILKRLFKRRSVHFNCCHIRQLLSLVQVYPRFHPPKHSSPPDYNANPCVRPCAFLASRSRYGYNRNSITGRK